MDFAVLSDIHGNYEALETCIKYALNRNILTFVFLGDYISDMAYPQKTMNDLYELQQKYSCFFIRGNKEDYWLNYKKGGEQGWREKDATTGSLLYQYRNLTQKDLQWFGSMPYKETLTFEHLPAITVCHGSPRDVDERISPDDLKTAYEILKQETNSLILCGHTHTQGIIEHCGKRILNPGAVGIAKAGKTEFMIFHGEDGTWSHEFLSLSYDAEKVVAEMKQSELYEQEPYWCQIIANVLLKGSPSAAAVLFHVIDLCREDLGECIWPNIPEKYWKQGIAELIH